jgi:hypothetical protein
LIRREKVMLDYDLAELYGVPTRTLNQAVKRNRDRFPEAQFRIVFDAIRELMTPPEPPKRQIGFHSNE